MSKLFVKTINQYGGELSDSDAVVVLNTVSKHINKKIRILEYKYGIKIKLQPLPENNRDCLPKSVGFHGIAQIEGPLRGQIPFYTNVNLAIPTPSLTPVMTGVPIGPIGSISPMIGVPGLAINPFGNQNSLEQRNKNALKYLGIIKTITEQLEQVNSGTMTKDSVDKTYFEFVDLEETDPIEELEKLLNKKLLNK
jgi:hypothetical protein